MRRVIFVIIFVLLGVVCLSSTIRLSDELYEFFYEDNSSGTSSNSSSNSSEPNDTQSPGGNTGTLVSATTFKRTEERFGLNYSIDTSFYVKQNEYYYYKLNSDENKFVKSDVILSGINLFTDCYDFVYVRVEESIPEDNLQSVIIKDDQYLFSSNYNIVKVNYNNPYENEIYTSHFVKYDNYAFAFHYFPLDIKCVVVCDENIIEGSGYNKCVLYEGSVLFGITSFSIDDYVLNETCDYYILHAMATPAPQ